MDYEFAVAVEKLVGSAVSPDGNLAMVGFIGGGREYKFSFTPDLLTHLALIAMNAKVECDKNASRPIDGVGFSTHAFPCDWSSIHKSSDGTSLLFSFHTLGGAWIRLKLPIGAATPMREALEAIEGRATSPPIGTACN